MFSFHMNKLEFYWYSNVNNKIPNKHTNFRIWIKVLKLSRSQEVIYTAVSMISISMISRFPLQFLFGHCQILYLRFF